uniref:Uncharacterized protein n=1 Tax=Panagrolaimus davidi TaxID=227884 RepID=A0A914QMU5_9BILA
MMLEGYKDGKWDQIISRMLPLKEPDINKLLYSEELDELVEKRCLNPLNSMAIVNGKGVAATLNSFFIVSSENKRLTIIREFSTCNELIKTYHLPFKVIDIAAGFRHVLLLDDNGKVYSHGVGMHGELGQGPYCKKYENGFLEIQMLQEQAPDGIKAIAVGALHSCVLTKTGDMYSFGMNEKGLLGPGIDDSSVFDPYPVDLPKSIKSIQTSLFANYVFYDDGSHDVFGDSSVPGITELNGMC